jgi:hypothetical protein
MRDLDFTGKQRFRRVKAMKLNRDLRFAIVILGLTSLFLLNPRWVSSYVGAIIFGMPMGLFVSHPERIAATASAIIILGGFLSYLQWRLAWPLLVAACGWLMFAIWEWHCKLQHYNIRADLLFIWPVLLGFTVWAFCVTFLPRDQSLSRPLRL